MKKKIITLVILVVVVGAFSIIYAVLSNSEQPADTGETDTGSSKIMLADFDYINICKIEYVSQTETLSFEKDTDKWYLSSDRSFPLDTTAVTAMATAIASIGAERFVEENPSDISQYGFDHPNYTIKITYSDGTNYTYLIGDYNLFNACNYFMVDGSGKVYMVLSALSDYFNHTLKDLAVLDTIPTFDSEKAVAFRLSSGTDSENDITITDSDKVAAMYKLFTTINTGNYYDYNTEDNELSTYSLSKENRKTITFLYGDVSSDKSVEDLIGELTDGENNGSIPEDVENKLSKYSIHFGVSPSELPDKVLFTVDFSKITYLADKETVNSMLALFE
ncbi:MAG: DUF4340 domain-containing protein [Oscillospiraceae bacterium]|nr:DUF4340 domain-containing protein [Oscillospiraceae bacterium]